MTQKEFESVLIETKNQLDTYVVETFGKKLILRMDWERDYPGVGASFGRYRDEVYINFQGWITRAPFYLGRDELQLTFCHELGHFVYTGAAEPEADYYAVRDCLPLIWKESNSQNEFKLRVINAANNINRFRKKIWEQLGHSSQAIDKRLECRQKQFYSAVRGEDYTACTPNFNGRIVYQGCPGSLLRFFNQDPNDHAQLLFSSECVKNSPHIPGLKQISSHLLGGNEEFLMVRLESSFNELKTDLDNSWVTTVSNRGSLFPKLDLVNISSKINMTTSYCRIEGNPVSKSYRGIYYNKLYKLQGTFCFFQQPGEVVLSLKNGGAAIATTLFEEQGHIYALPLHSFAGCIANNQLDLSLPGCENSPR
tara:strand:+ start:14593 stop:15690 length:1098 start_codon:yes stop_codon:yes gene_type:complete